MKPALKRRIKKASGILNHKLNCENVLLEKHRNMQEDSKQKDLESSSIWQGQSEEHDDNASMETGIIEGKFMNPRNLLDHLQAFEDANSFRAKNRCNRKKGSA